MRKTKFWLVQIVMLILVSLVFGSAAFAVLPDHAKGKKGAEMSYTALTNHAGGHSQGMLHANGNAAFMGTSVPDPDPEPDPEPDPDPGDDASGCAPGEYDYYGDGSLCL